MSEFFTQALGSMPSGPRQQAYELSVRSALGFTDTEIAETMALSPQQVSGLRAETRSALTAAYREAGLRPPGRYSG